MLTPRRTTAVLLAVTAVTAAVAVLAGCSKEKEDAEVSVVGDLGDLTIRDGLYTPCGAGSLFETSTTEYPDPLTIAWRRVGGEDVEAEVELPEGVEDDEDWAPGISCLLVGGEPHALVEYGDIDTDAASDADDLDELGDALVADTAYGVFDQDGKPLWMKAGKVWSVGQVGDAIEIRLTPDEAVYVDALTGEERWPEVHEDAAPDYFVDGGAVVERGPDQWLLDRPGSDDVELELTGKSREFRRTPWGLLAQTSDETAMLDLETGKAKWSAAAAEDDEPEDPALSFDVFGDDDPSDVEAGVVIVPTDGGAEALDAKTGRRLWATREISELEGTDGIDEFRVVAAGHGRVLVHTDWKENEVDSKPVILLDSRTGEQRPTGGHIIRGIVEDGFLVEDDELEVIEPDKIGHEVED